MANIAISDLHPIGFDLLSDTESYMRELSDTELNAQGGIVTIAAVLVGAFFAYLFWE